jgi:hypothetical protein
MKKRQSYEAPELITYGSVEKLTQMPKGGNGGGNGGGSGGGGGGFNNKRAGADDGQKSKIL